MNTSATPFDAQPLHGLDPKSLGLVAIIDDAYDPPLPGDFAREDYAVFFDAVGEEPLKQYWMENYGDIFDEDDITEEILLKLWSSYKVGTLGILAEEVVKLFDSKHEDYQIIKNLEEHLTSWNVKFQPYGTDDKPEGDFDVVFIDYQLGPRSKAADSAVSLERAKSIRSAAGDKKPPFIILMSSKPEVSGLKETFRKMANLNGVLFGFIPKGDLREKGNLHLHLGSFGVELKQYREIDRFVFGLTKSMTEVAEKFTQDVLSLGAQDYCFLQKECLLHDGHPLGDYIMWLMSSMLTYHLRNHEKAKVGQGKLDAMVFDFYIHEDPTPTAALARLHQMAITEPVVPDSLEHPLGQADEWLLDLGDLFFSANNISVFMVMNASCDLSFAPMSKRKCDPERSIFLIPGKLVPHVAGSSTAPETLYTEHFEHENKVYRIQWEFDRVICKKHKEMITAPELKGFTRKYRLRQLYALQVQQRFSSLLSRVGTPKAPPSPKYFNVSLHFCDSESRVLIPIGKSITRGAMLFDGKAAEGTEKKILLISSSCAREIWSHGTTIVEHMKGISSKIQNVSRKDAQERRITLFEGVLREPMALLSVFRVHHNDPNNALQHIAGANFIAYSLKKPDLIGASHDKYPILLVLELSEEPV